jgi:Flp pilus assembly protein TadD
MAIRSSSSLRRHFIWTIVSVVLVAAISIIWIAVYQATKSQLAQPAIVGNNSQGVPLVEHPDNKAPLATDEPTHDSAVAKAPRTSGAKPVGTFHSPRYGYTVSLEGTVWQRWEDLAEIVPEAEWGALLKDYGRFLVIPFALGGIDVRQEALDQALLARLGIAFPSDQVSEFEAIEHSGAVGHGFEFSRDVAGNENLYRVWVLRRGGCAYLAAAWIDVAAAEKSSPEPLDDIVAALNRLTFDEAATSGPAIEELNPRQRQSHSVTFNDLGQFTYNARDFSGAVECFRHAFRLQPNDPTILTNLVNSHVELQQYREALGELDQSLSRFPTHWDLWAARAFLLSKLGETDAALAVYARLFAAGYRAEGPFTQYLTLLAENDRTADALAAAEQFLQVKTSFAVRRLQAALHRQRGEHQQAIAILTDLARNRPFSAELSYDLADSLWSTDQFAEALAVCQALHEHGYDTAHTYLLEARSRFALKQYGRSRQALEEAMRRDGANKEAQELLALVTAASGEGDNRAIQQPIEPVAIWPELQQPAIPQNVPQVQGYGACVIRRLIAMRFEPNRDFRQTDYRTIRIIDASGLARYGAIQVPFDPLGEQIFVNRLRVLNSRGDELAVGKISDYYVTDADRSQAASHVKVLNIPVPGLQIGCTIELVLSRRDLAPSADFPYTNCIFSSDVPVLSSLLQVETDPAVIRYRASAGIKLTESKSGLAWSIEEPVEYRSEPLQEPRSAFLPRVVIASSGASWPELAREYLSSIKENVEPNEAIKRLAAELTQNQADDESRVIALVRYVQDHLAYKPIEFGRHARIPAAAAEVIKNKYGDCKDHAALLVQLLAARQIPAQLVLANLDDAIDPDLPALEQFNHILVYVPGFRGGKFFDCTDKNSDLASLEVPLDLGGTRGLVLDNQPRLLTLPDYSADSSHLHSERTIRLAANADATVEEAVTASGYHAALLREEFKDIPAGRRAAMLQEELTPYGGAVQVTSFEIEHLLEREKPLVLKATYLVRNNFKPVDGKLVGQLPALWERMYLGSAAVTDRRTPFTVEYPLVFSSEVKMKAAPGFTLQVSDASESDHASEFVSWKRRNTSVEPDLQVSYELRLNSGHYSAAQYASYQDEMERALAALSQTVSLNPKP